MLKFIHLTDIHLPANETDILYGINIHSVVYQIAEKISQIKDVDCIIITGDIANKGDYNSYIALDDAVKDIDVPIFWVQGNHDFSEVMLQVSSKVKIKSDKSFSIKNTKFILLQSVMRDEDDLSQNKGRGFLFNYEMNFLERELEENNFDNYVIALHHPPVLSNYWTDRRILDNRLEFISLIEKFPKVKVVLYGHQHITQHIILNNIDFICSPPVSYHYDPNGDKFSILENKRGFGVIEIANNSNIKCEFIYIE